MRTTVGHHFYGDDPCSSSDPVSTLDRESAATFSFPALYLNVASYSASAKLHVVSFELLGMLYVVRIVICEHGDRLSQNPIPKFI